MEVAISSALSHPNIVQTYSYDLRPVLEALSSSERTSSNTLGSAEVACSSIPLSQRLPASGKDSVSETRLTPASRLRGLELRLVLQFCDCGSLRDVLDQGAFLQGKGVNYRAVLETALDIARGMMQLHALNLVHSDLKVWSQECGVRHDVAACIGSRTLRPEGVESPRAAGVWGGV